MTKVIIAGGRDFNNYELLKEECDEFLKGIEDIEIVSGGAYGADKLGERYAKERGYDVQLFIPNWKLHKNSAGVKRNWQMACYSNILIAFWDGSSRGTANMIELARKKKLFVKVVNYQNTK